MERSRSSHPPADAAFSPSLRRLAWLNIAVQAALPLAVAFTPAMARAGEQHFLSQPVPLSAQRTQVYTLSSGETAASVAKKYHLTLQQLRELNQFRTFAHGLNGLLPGDDVDVPLITAKDYKNASVTSGGPAVDESSERAQKVAGFATQAGSFLAGTAKSDAAASMARGMATGEAGGALQQWLSHFGTARVQLDADKNFSLKNSQFDLLMPLYDRGDNLVFTQGSLHRTDGRTQANLGAGLRHFYGSWMFGANTFIDYDLSRDHARAGAGMEYWRNFIKLGFNGYTHLTGWKDSPDLTDYQERPANGWDIRAQAWVPSLPQLGGKLTYEQYYGKEVALFGVDSRQKNPHAITAGINYTPVPLITLGAEQRQGQSGESDTRITVDMKYQLGVPWRNQVDPTAVAAMRSLIGSRYDLVERNNNIVLEYRKKDTIRLHTADLVTGHAGEQKSLGVSVTSTYGLSRIDWDAQALAAAGGKIVQNGSDYAVVLPAYQLSAQGVNTYTVSGVAVDRKGNRSDRSDTQVTVQSPEVNKQASTFTPVSSLLPADGRSAQALTLTLRDGNNQAVDMDVKDISLNSSALKSATVSALTRKSAGVYTLTVTAGTDAERVTLTPSVSGVTLSPAEVTISSVTPDAGQSQFSARPETIVADNTTFSTLTLVAKDTQGNALGGLKDSLTFTVKDSSGKAAGDTITESAIAESSTKGTYTATLKGTAPGKYTIVPEYNGTAMGSLSATVTLKTTAPEQTQSAISTDKTSYVSGTDMVVKVTLKDAAGDAVTGAMASLTTDTVKVANATLKTGSSWKDNGDGTYTATYTAGVAGDSLKATVQLTDWSGKTESAAYAITAGAPVQAQSAISTDKTSYVSGTDMVVKVTLKDAAGDAVTGAMASLTTDTVKVANATLKTGSSWKDNGDGTYTATYTAGMAGDSLKATVQLTDWSGKTESATYAITAGAPVQAQSAISTDKTSYVSGTDMVVKVTLKDAAGDAVTGAMASLTTDTVKVANATLKTGSSWKDNGDGTYTATYTAGVAGDSLKATVQLTDWSGKTESAAYAITAGAPVQAQSAISTDKTSYVSGTDMVVKVTLKDAAGDAVTGAMASLTTDTVKVANATLKTGSSWKDNGDGTYTATYTAGVAGDSLKATVQLTDWSGKTESATYAITAGAPVQAQSAISTDKTSYVSGTDMVVKVTLKDAAGNAVTGAMASLTTDTVKVANATLKTGSSWKDNGDGTYTATYTAGVAGDSLKATVQLTDWSGKTESAAYAITAGAPVQAQSAISTDKTSYVSGTDMVVKVTLKDAAGDAVTGAMASLTTDTVKVANATLKTGSSWKDNGDGTYTATYTAGMAGDSLKATVQLTDWGSSADSNAYAITFGDEAPQSINTQVNSHTFTVSGEEGAFPSTGFVGATFTIVPKNGAAGSEYVWKTDASWISVTDGVVRFTGKGSGDKVTITGTPVNGRGNLIKYSFTLKNWFISNTVGSNWGDANSFCNSNSGYNLADVSIVSTKSRETGALWSEWGDLSNYSGGSIPAANLWTSSLEVSDLYYYVTSTNGGVYAGSTSNKFTAICNNNL